MVRFSARTLHGLAEDIYEALDREGYWDDREAPRGRRSRRTRTGAQRSLARKPRKAKRRPSKANTRYSRCFKKLKPKYMKKNGGWKKDGFARCVRASHKCARRDR